MCSNSEEPSIRGQKRKRTRLTTFGSFFCRQYVNSFMVCRPKKALQDNRSPPSPPPISPLCLHGYGRRAAPRNSTYRSADYKYDGFYIPEVACCKKNIPKVTYHARDQKFGRAGGVLLYEVKNYDDDLVKDPAKYALQQYNKSQGTSLELKKVVRANAKTAGAVYYLTLEASNDCFYEAIVSNPDRSRDATYKLKICRPTVHWEITKSFRD